MRDYNQEFIDLVNDAIEDGWHPEWIDRAEGNNVYIYDDFIDNLRESEEATCYFRFTSPEEWNKMLEEDKSSHWYG